MREIRATSSARRSDQREEALDARVVVIRRAHREHASVAADDEIFRRRGLVAVETTVATERGHLLQRCRNGFARHGDLRARRSVIRLRLGFAHALAELRDEPLRRLDVLIQRLRAGGAA